MTFLEFLQARIAAGGLSADEALRAALPLLRQIVESHEAGKVAPLIGATAVHESGGQLYYERARELEARDAGSALREWETREGRTLEVVGEVRQTTDADSGETEWTDLSVARPGEKVTRPLYRPGYLPWEEALGHHDAAADLFSGGMILASLVFGLDFTDAGALRTFASHRENLFQLRPQLHPVLAQMIARMTELNRHRRPPELAAVVRRLEHYREVELDVEFDVSSIEGFHERDYKGKREIVLARLRERLFEISRRNRLLYFKATGQSVDLTQSSVPLSFDLRSIRPSDLLTWNGDVEAQLSKGETLSLQRYLRFEETPYLPGALDRIRTEARRDARDYGFAQLRLVLAFLRWHDLKSEGAEREERIHSPLLLLPVDLVKRKGVQDVWVLEPQGTEAEVNPVLRHHLRQLYGIALPERIDLSETDLATFHGFLEKQILASQPGVSLELVRKPRIQLIQEQARRRLNQYLRRVRVRGRSVRTWKDLDYSYARENFQPLGLRLFAARIRPSTLRLSALAAGGPPPPRVAAEPDPASETPDPASETKERRVAAFLEGSGNPYTWEMDCCRLTLANFKYRRLSLVRDYDALLNDGRTNRSFDSLFSLEPRPIEEVPPPRTPEEDWTIHPCDATQGESIDLARAGRSFIIQGPPGTGKSQTITNLIADAVARGQRVLFVCQKRAAIDVVYHRLRQHGLDELCCLVHDSQTDKKEVIQDLKRTYETFLAASDGKPAWEERRAAALHALTRDLEPLRQFDGAMRNAPESAGVPLRALLHRLVALRAVRPSLSAAEEERLPPYALWARNVEAIGALDVALGGALLGEKPLRQLRPEIALEDRPLESLLRAIERGAAARLKLRTALPDAGGWTLEESAGAIAHAATLRPFAERGILEVLDGAGELAARLRADLADQAGRAEEFARLREENRWWKERLSPQDLAAALSLARSLQGRFGNFFRPAWWRLRRVIYRHYDLGKHVVGPTWVTILEGLEKEYAAAAALERADREVANRYHWTEGLQDLAERCERLRTAGEQASEPLRGFHASLLANPTLTSAAANAGGTLAEFRAALDSLLVVEPGATLDHLGDTLDLVEEASGDLPDFLAVLDALRRVPKEIARELRSRTLSADALEAAIAHSTWERLTRADRLLARFDHATRRGAVARVERDISTLRDTNGETVRDRARRRFLKSAALAQRADSQLEEEEKQAKKRYGRGRRELEHEFGKSMRYRSIRELLESDAGAVLLDLKPVWLMSPLSVSDTLPLGEGIFDLVLFDEASQVPLEEAVPALFRAPQVIVVGDEMQLPPTAFFAARRDEDEMLAIEGEGEDAGELIEYDLSANSFLNQAGKNLPSTLLGWHYRSRSEALISFSNAAFYEGRLLTIPEEEIGNRGAGEIPVPDAMAGDTNANALLERSLSFHHLPGGVYERRRNTAEAEYIARLIRALLLSGKGLTIGVIAFSEQQQGEIEGALERLAGEDAEFRRLLEQEWEREEEGQFVGLLVKNLENIQGDERDIVILSICYGPDPEGKMRMNFGPINQAGGEKRLNVAFTRAKHHMAVVSSVTSPRITNVYNDGANALRQYLRFSEAISRGEGAAARQVLEELCGRAAEEGRAPPPDAVVEEFASALRERGWEVDFRVGQSGFRVDVAIHKPGDRIYRLGVLIDTDAHYAQRDLIERDLMRPRLLEIFGWKMASFLTKEWLEDREAVLGRIEARLTGQEEAPPELPDEPPPPPPAPPEAKPQPMRLEFEGEGSSKFWEVTVVGRQHTVRFGRMGSAGQTLVREFESESEAKADAERLVRSKLRKGYRAIMRP